MNTYKEITLELEDLVTLYKYQDMKDPGQSEKVDLSKYKKIIEKTKPTFNIFGMENK